MELHSEAVREVLGIPAYITQFKGVSLRQWSKNIADGKNMRDLPGQLTENLNTFTMMILKDKQEHLNLIL